MSTNTKEIQLTEEDKNAILNCGSGQLITYRVLDKFYSAYTQLYMPATLFNTLQECVVKILLEYFTYCQSSCNLAKDECAKAWNLKSSRKMISELIKKHCKGKGDNHASQFLAELDRCYFAVYGIEYTP